MSELVSDLGATIGCMSVVVQRALGVLAVDYSWVIPCQCANPETLLFVSYCRWFKMVSGSPLKCVGEVCIR